MRAPPTPAATFPNRPRPRSSSYEKDGKTKPAGHAAVLLTDSLTRRRETDEMWRETRDGSLGCVLVSATQRHPRDHQDARRGAHNPAIYRARSVPERADIRGLQRSLADSASDGQAGPEQVDPLPETTF